MTINIDALKASVAKIERLGQDELTFPAGESEITIRALKSGEELEVEKYGQIAWDESTGDEDRSALADYLDRMRVGTLSHVIVRVDDLDLRGEEFIETGEKTEEGTPVKRPRYVVMRQLIREWNRHILHLCYLKYAELMQKIELSAGKAIEFDAKDVDAEITRISKRLEDLHDLKKNVEADPEDTRSTQVRKAITDLGVEREDQIANAAESAARADQMRREEQTVATRKAAADKAAGIDVPPPAARQRVAPKQATPPSREVAQAPAEPQAARETDAMGIPRPHEGDSMFDTSDPEAAMHAEHERLLEHRRQMNERNAVSQPAPEAELPPEAAPATGRRAPHRDALNTANATLNFSASEEVQGRPKGSSQDVQGVRLPVETISPREGGSGQPGRGAKAPVNQGATGSKNPRFRGPGG